MGMTTDTMLSSLEANGVLHLSMAQIGDLMDLDRRVKEGDECGWRGDPTMGIFINRFTGEFEVWGVDRGGNQYKAASHHKLDHTLLIKLREGDPTKHDVFQRVLDANEKLKADRDQANREKAAEVADKLAWGIRQDFSQHLGGRRRQWHIDKGESSPVTSKD